MSNPFDTDPATVVDELKKMRQRLEQQMVKYAVFKKLDGMLRSAARLRGQTMSWHLPAPTMMVSD